MLLTYPQRVVVHKEHVQNALIACCQAGLNQTHGDEARVSIYTNTQPTTHAEKHFKDVW